MGRRRVARRTGNRAARWLNNASAAYNTISAGVDMYNRFRGSGSSTATTRSKTREMAPLTSQQDVRVNYRRRPMPKRRKRRYVKNVKRFRSLQMRDQPARIFNFVAVRNPTFGVNTSRYFGAFMGLPGQNTYDTSFTEVWNNIANPANTAAKVNAARLRIDSMSLQVVIRNTSVAGSGESGVIDLDVYKVICQRDIPIAQWPGGLDIEEFLASEKDRLRQATGMDIEVNDAGTGIANVLQNAGSTSTTQVVGDTLWNNPTALRHWKIIKQWKVQIPVNGVVSFNLRSARNKPLTRAECFSTSALSAKKYFTQGYIFNANGRYNFGPPAQFEDGALTVEQYVRYNCKMHPQPTPTLTYDAA